MKFLKVNLILVLVLFLIFFKFTHGEQFDFIFYNSTPYDVMISPATVIDGSRWKNLWSENKFIAGREKWEPKVISNDGDPASLKFLTAIPVEEYESNNLVKYQLLTCGFLIQPIGSSPAFPHDTNIVAIRCGFSDMYSNVSVRKPDWDEVSLNTSSLPYYKTTIIKLKYSESQFESQFESQQFKPQFKSQFNMRVNYEHSGTYVGNLKRDDIELEFDIDRARRPKMFQPFYCANDANLRKCLYINMQPHLDKVQENKIVFKTAVLNQDKRIPLLFDAGTPGDGWEKGFVGKPLVISDSTHLSEAYNKVNDNGIYSFLFTLPSTLNSTESGDFITYVTTVCALQALKPKVAAFNCGYYGSYGAVAARKVKEAPMGIFYNFNNEKDIYTWLRTTISNELVGNDYKLVMDCKAASKFGGEMACNKSEMLVKNFKNYYSKFVCKVDDNIQNCLLENEQAVKKNDLISNVKGSQILVKKQQ